MSPLAASVVLAHIGNIPVEEWVPFVVPVLALVIYVRRKDRHRRRVIARLPDASASLGETTVQRILAAWRAADYGELSAEHLPLLYPPGPDGLSVAQLAERTGASAETVERLLDQLAEHEYLDVEPVGERHEARALLTLKGYGLVNATEDALVSAVAAPEGLECPRLDSNQQPPA